MIRKYASALLSLAIIISILACPAWAADTKLTARNHAFPKVGPYEVLSGDFHMHTINSDGKLTTRQRVEEAYSLGYDVIAVTDHGKTRAYTIAKYVGEPLGMVVLRGVETGVSGKEHMNALGFSSLYQPANPHRWSETPGAETVYYRDELKKIADTGGFVLYNHPHVGFREPVEWGVKEDMIQGIEVKNDVVGTGWATIEWNGLHCYPNAFEYGLKNNLTLFANTDVHSKRSDNPARTLVFATARTPEAVMDAFHARRTAAWFDGVVWGRKELLTDLMQSAVKVSRSVDGLGNPCLRIENHSPLTLKAAIQGVADPVEIGLYQEMPVKYTAAGNKVSITWANIWTSPKDNLTTVHTCPADK